MEEKDIGIGAGSFGWPLPSRAYFRATMPKLTWVGPFGPRISGLRLPVALRHQEDFVRVRVLDLGAGRESAHVHIAGAGSVRAGHESRLALHGYRIGEILNAGRAGGA